MESQHLINTALGLGFSVLGWFARELWGAVKQLQKDIHQIEIDLPSKYVPKEEYSDSFKEIKELCSKIFDKLDALEQRKADK